MEGLSPPGPRERVVGKVPKGPCLGLVLQESFRSSCCMINGLFKIQSHSRNHKHNWFILLLDVSRLASSENLHLHLTHKSLASSTRVTWPLPVAGPQPSRVTVFWYQQGSLLEALTSLTLKVHSSCSFCNHYIKKTSCSLVCSLDTMKAKDFPSLRYVSQGSLRNPT